MNKAVIWEIYLPVLYENSILESKWDVRISL